ncbi:MAG: Ppx/GppA family phosphatase [Burkholderiaceae bacterium]|nr:Ppx/GppA family phosphatase [Burkholderiaceae bacterium]
MFAAVDLGSNSFRMHIGRHDGEAMRILKSARDPIRLAAGLDGRGNMTEAAMRAALECLARFKTILDTYPLDAVRVVATNTMRIAKNAPTFLPLAEKAIGHPIEIISGEEEGRLIYMGVSSTLANHAERRLVLDIGGGSTELILGHGQEIERVESFSIGNVRQTLNFFPGGRINSASFDAAILSARSHFEDAAPPYYPQYWSSAYGSSGTIRSIADAIEKNKLGDGSLSMASLEALKQRLIEYGEAHRINLVGMKPDRAAVMAGGLAILIGVMREIGIERMTAIEAGLRVGVLWDLQLRATKRDRRELSVQEFLRRFHLDEGRAKRVADTAALLYGQLKPSSDDFARHLYWSGLLHEVGLAVSQSGYHKHAAYMIENADLPGFTTREQRLMSLLVLGHKGNLRKLGEAMANPDLAKAVLALRLAVIFMHARIDVAVDELRVKMKSKIELEIGRGWFSHHPTMSFWMDKERESWNEIGMDFVVKNGS